MLKNLFEIRYLQPTAYSDAVCQVVCYKPSNHVQLKYCTSIQIHEKYSIYSEVVRQF